MLCSSVPINQHSRGVHHSTAHSRVFVGHVVCIVHVDGDPDCFCRWLIPPVTGKNSKGRLAPSLKQPALEFELNSDKHRYTYPKSSAVRWICMRVSAVTVLALVLSVLCCFCLYRAVDGSVRIASSCNEPEEEQMGCRSAHSKGRCRDRPASSSMGTVPVQRQRAAAPIPHVCLLSTGLLH